MKKTANTHPLVSVLFPVYNTARYLEEALESILAQTFEDFELIIIDDGSTDASLKILQAYAARDARILLSSRENKGLAQTRNELLGQAKGEYIAIMDSDDVALPYRLARQVEFLQKELDVVCLGGAFELIDEAGRMLVSLPAPTNNEEIQQLMLAGHTAIHHATAMMRRASLLKVGGYPETMATGGDLDLFLRLGEVGKMANLTDTVLKYRQHMNSISALKHTQQIEDKKVACEQAWERRGIEGHFEATEPWRPDSSNSSQHHFMLKYGWWAFNSSHRKTAINYGLRAIRFLPLKISGWELLICALIKRMPEKESNKIR